MHTFNLGTWQQRQADLWVRALPTDRVSGQLELCRVTLSQIKTKQNKTKQNKTNKRQFRSLGIPSDSFTSLPCVFFLEAVQHMVAPQYILGAQTADKTSFTPSLWLHSGWQRELTCGRGTLWPHSLILTKAPEFKITNYKPEQVCVKDIIGSSSLGRTR